MNTRTPLILASTSPRRAELLKSIGLAFDVRSPHADETPHPGEMPADFAVRAAREKAESIECPDGTVVLGADTVVALEDKIFGKPSDPGEAEAMLRQLSGKQHEVMTGVCLRSAAKTVCFHVSTDVLFRVLSDQEISAYVATGDPLDKAGAYAIQGGAAGMVRRIDGSYSNVVGLPLCEVLEVLDGFGAEEPEADSPKRNPPPAVAAVPQPAPLPAGLYIVGTPIGHLGDMSARGIQTLKEAALIIAEDTRTTHTLLGRFGIKTRCISCHKFNEEQRSGEILARIRSGEAVAMVTDSGMPCISDPGARMVRACRGANLPVTAVPGPTAAATALALSGFDGHGFLFAGFLPRKSGARRRILEQCAALPVPVIFYESPYRLFKLLEELQAVAGPERRLFAARELTKKFEELLSGTAKDILAAFGTRTVKGECVVILDKAP